MRLAEQERHDPVMETCLFDKGEASLPHPIKDCLTKHSTASKTILIGDSHAGALGGEALRSFDAADVDLYVMAHSSCVGFSGFYVSNLKYRLRCNPFFTGIEDYIRTSGIKTIIMANRWSLYIDGTPFDNGEGGIEPLQPTYMDLLSRLNEHAAQDDPARKARVLKQYIDDIQAYLDSGHNVVLVYPIPEAGWNVPDLVAKSAMAGVPEAGVQHELCALPATQWCGHCSLRCHDPSQPVPRPPCRHLLQQLYQRAMHQQPKRGKSVLFR